MLKAAAQPDPYEVRNRNPNNQYITRDHIEQIFDKLKIADRPNNIANYQLAFVHKSYLIPTDEQLELEAPLSPDEYIEKEFEKLIPLQTESYEQTEFLGDSVLGSIITDYICERYPDKDEGFLTPLKTQLVRGTNLCILAKKLNFDRYILLSKKLESRRNNDAVLEDVLEAFIGAIYKDFGRRGQAYEICQNFIIRLMERYLNMSQFVRRQDNYKDILLRYFHKNFNGANPRYTLISTYGPTNNRTFKAGVINTYGDVITTGEGAQLKYAEQAAAKEALKYYEVEVYSDSEEPDQLLYSSDDD